MTLWFGPFIEIEPAHGYFHLCPSCYRECVAPHMEEIEHTLARLNPAAAAYLERERAADAGRQPAGGQGEVGKADREDTDPEDGTETSSGTEERG